ncbi:MAG: stringent starvation protein A [Gammaproteobacteria bacterium]|nr:stringent starvation protein A [Gammaproteobacteria bacterium]
MTSVKRSVMTLHSGALDLYSHRVRIVLAEKGVNVDILHINPHSPPQHLVEINPYASVPTLVDRDLVLYESRVIMEYLDERFPHPPLLPVYPIARAQCRLMMHRIEKDWLSILPDLDSDDPEKAEVARKELREQLSGIAPLFSEMPYFLSEEFSLVDCYIAPLLWRLPYYGIELPNAAKPIREYTKRVFDRVSFQSSLSDLERELQDDYEF